MQTRIFNATWLLITAVLVFTSCRPLESMNRSNRSLESAVVTVLLPVGSQTIRTTNRTTIKMIQEWLTEVRATQLPPEQIGAVIPWCTIIFYEGSHDRPPASTNLVYAIRDRTTRHELLTKEQRQKLLSILESER